MIECYKRKLGKIPCLILRDTRYRTGPLLLHYHAMGDNKGNPLCPDLALVQIASEGVIVVCPDCHEHGKRKGRYQTQKLMNGWAFTCQVIERTCAESPRLLEEIFSLPFVRKKRSQVSGISMGAIIAQLMFGRDRRFTSLVSVVGRSSLRQVNRWSQKSQEGTFADAWCIDEAPQAHPERYGKRPALFIDGGRDPLCPPPINKEMVRIINANRGNATQFVDPRAGHEFSNRMRAKFVQWVLEHGDLSIKR